MTDPTTPSPETTPTPAPNPSDNAPGTAPKARSPKALWMVVVAAVLLVGGLGAWYLMRPPKPASVTTTPTPAAAGVLRVGTIIDEDGLEADTKEYRPFLDYLASQLHDQGITKAQFVAKTSVSDMAKSLRQGEVDVYIDSIFPVFVADRLAGSQLMADRWKEGVEKYHTAIFVKKDSPIKTVADLKGKTLAFDSSTSTVGYFLPKAELAKAGYKLTEKAKTTDPVAADEIGYTYVHDKVFDDVAGGVTPAGAESEQEIRDHFGATFDQNYRIIMTSPDVLRFAVTARKDLNPKLRAALKTLLFGMDKSAAGKDVLKQFSDTAKFTDVPADSDAAYGEIRNLTDYVEDEIVRGGVGASK